ncbi:MAG: metalloregulator ArsR/SmtB family transcription factor [Dehalococcoidia bacterium]|nr:metalloregulator ArsR/SmtB family transcription factor [Dehalococcoidia bacterium]
MTTLTLTKAPSLCDQLKVLSDENRMRILILLRDGERCVCDIVNFLGLPQSLVSHHLAVLRNAALLRDRRSGKWVYYSINKDGVSQLSALLVDVLDPANISTESAPDYKPDKCHGS